MLWDGISNNQIIDIKNYYIFLRYLLKYLFQIFHIIYKRNPQQQQINEKICKNSFKYIVDWLNFSLNFRMNPTQFQISLNNKLGSKLNVCDLLFEEWFRINTNYLKLKEARMQTEILFL